MDRLAVAKDRIRSVKAELSSPARDFPCIQCRHFEIVCTHPAASKISVSPISGNTSVVHYDAAKVRADDGVCGPEAALFDGRSAAGQMVVAVINSSAGRWALFLGAAVGLDLLLR